MKTRKVMGKKGEGELLRIAIALVLVGAFITGMLTAAISMDEVYNMGFDDTQYETFIVLKNLDANTSIEGLQQFEASSGEITGQTFLSEGQIQAGVTSSKLLLNLPALATSMFSDIGVVLVENLHINPIYPAAAISIVLLTALAVTLALVFKRLP